MLYKSDVKETRIDVAENHSDVVLPTSEPLALALLG